jgi:hypothetical protein
LGPTIAVYSRTNVNAWNDVVPVSAFGNLRSFVDYSSDMFGWAVGNNLTLAPTNGFIGLTADIWNGLRLFNVDQRFYSGGSLFLALNSNSGLSLYANQSTPDYAQRGVSWLDSGTDLTLSGLAGYRTATATYLNVNAGSFALGLDAYLNLAASPASGRSAQVAINAYTTDTNRATVTVATGPAASSLNLFVGTGYLHLQNNDIRLLDNSIGQLHITKTYTGWPDGAGYHAEICNETTSAFGQLMIVGNKYGVARGVGIWDRLQIGGTSFYQALNVAGSAWISGSLGVGPSVYSSPNGLQVTTPVSETGSGFANVRMGTLAGTPRVIWEYPGYTQWEMDTYQGELRFYTPGQVRMSLNSSGYMSINGATYDQVFNVQGGIRSAGGSSIFLFTDRAGTSPVNWGWYATGGVARLWNNMNGDVFDIWSSGTSISMLFDGRLGAGGLFRPWGPIGAITGEPTATSPTAALGTW